MTFDMELSVSRASYGNAYFKHKIVEKISAERAGSARTEKFLSTLTLLFSPSQTALNVRSIQQTYYHPATIINRHLLDQSKI